MLLQLAMPVIQRAGSSALKVMISMLANAVILLPHQAQLTIVTQLGNSAHQLVPSQIKFSSPTPAQQVKVGAHLVTLISTSM